ncbi:hypothetical protein Hanom_Chr13g01192151 [Helianthus anomalus]
MFVPNCRCRPFPLNLTSFVLNVSKSCTLCSLALMQLVFFVKYGHVSCTLGYFCHYTSLWTFVYKIAYRKECCVKVKRYLQIRDISHPLHTHLSLSLSLSL